jgi:hypothetical protein
MRSLNPITSSAGSPRHSVPVRTMGGPQRQPLSLVACELFEDGRGRSDPPCSNDGPGLATTHRAMARHDRSDSYDLPRPQGWAAVFPRNHAPGIAANGDRFAINALTRFANYSCWPCWAIQARYA